MPEFLGNGKDIVPVRTPDNLKWHGGGAVNGIFVAAGRTETALAPERNKLVLTTGTTPIHGTAERRVSAIKHPVNGFHDGCPGMCGV